MANPYDFQRIAQQHQKSAAQRRKKTPLWRSPGMIVVVLLVVAGGAGWKFYPSLARRFQTQDGGTSQAAATVEGSGAEGGLRLRPFDVQSIDEMSRLSVKAVIDAPGLTADQIDFTIDEKPQEAIFNDKSGELWWTPREEDGPGEYRMKITAWGPGDIRSEQELVVRVNELNQAPVLDELGDQVVDVRTSRVLSLTVKARDADLPPQTLRFTLEPGAPAGAKIDADSGALEWDVSQAVSGREYAIAVRVTDSGPEPNSAVQTFKVRLEGYADPVEQFVADAAALGRRVQMVGVEGKPLLGGRSRVLEIDGEQVRTYSYASAAELEQDARQISADGMTVGGQPQVWRGPATFYRTERLIVLYVGRNEELLAVLGGLSKRLATTLTDLPPLGEPGPADGGQADTAAAAAAQAAVVDPLEAEVLALDRRRQLFVPRNYPLLRKIYAERFERDQDGTLRAALGSQYDSVMKWLGEHAEIKQELFTALDPQHDDVGAAMGLFAELLRGFPQRMAAYGNLAIAVAVTWDKDQGVYDYSGHQRRTKSVLPDGQIGAVENFRYLVDAEPVMQGRVQNLPWEFLVHLVNHTTPLGERQWAVQNYVGKRAMFGKCYDDVPYDFEMLRTNSAVCELAGKSYDLASIRQYGGVCAMQADFAARVGKSMGVPAAYVGGEANSGLLHAWVMWVELQPSSTKNSIRFSLESHGRYNIDQYYVGTLRDPKTGEQTTDRELELRLHTVGMNPQGKRHADLVMRAYPMIRGATEMSVADQLTFLREVIRLSPGNEAAWIAAARISREGQVTAQHHKAMSLVLESLFATFASFPDFTWKIFDDLVAYQADAKQRNALYERLVGLYEAAGRPDLACEARLKVSDYLAGGGEKQKAVEGLAATILKFPEEGRYVPQMLDKLEETCRDFADADKHLVGFYQEFLPKVPKRRGDDPSEYAMKMYDRAAKRYRELGHEALAQAAQAELDRLKQGSGQ